MYNEEDESPYDAQYYSEMDDLEDDFSEDDGDYSDGYEYEFEDESESEYDSLEGNENEFDNSESDFEDEIISCENCEWDWKLSEGGNDPFDCHNCGHSNSHLYIDENEEFYQDSKNDQEFDFASDFDDYDLDELVDDLDFSEFTAGEFKANFSNANQKILQKKSGVTKTIPLSNRVLLNTEKSKIANIKVPTDRQVIVEGKERFQTLRNQTVNPIKKDKSFKGNTQTVKKVGTQQSTTSTRTVGDKVGINPNQFKIDSIKVPTDRQVIVEGKERFQTTKNQTKKTIQPEKRIKRTPQVVRKSGVQQSNISTRPVGGKVGINPSQFKIDSIKVPTDRQVIIEGKKPIRPINNNQRPKLVNKRPTEPPKEKRPFEPNRKIKPYNRPITSKRPTVRPSKRPKIELPVERRAQIDRSKKKIARILVPSNRKVIVEGVNKFILSQNPQDDIIKNIGYYKGKKLKQLVLVFNNDTPNPFTIELFSPSAPLDYLFNTSQNLNNKIEVAGNQVPYSDVVYNLVANPTWVHNCKFTFSGTNVDEQKAIPLRVIDRQVTGDQYIQPLNINTQIDNMQVFSDVIYFGITQMLNRPYIPDGMDVIQYTVMPFTQVTMAFYYEQVTQKDLYYEKSDSFQTTSTV